MDERRILSTSRHSASDVARANFGIARKGYDQAEVRAYLDNIAREMQMLEGRMADLQAQLADALRRAEHPVLDEATLAAALGAQSAAILRSAHEEAGRVTGEAQERATAIFAQAQERAATYLVEAQERAAAIVSDAEATATQVGEDALAAAQRLTDSARVNGEALVERAREQGRAIVIQAHDARRAVLNDLAVKRKALHVQIDQMRAARDSLQDSITTVRESVEAVLTGLMSSDEGARSAAIEALRNRPVTPDPTEEELLAAVPIREVPEVVEPPLDTLVDDVPPPAPPPAKPRADEPSGADVVEELFARLRKATLEDRGASSPPAKRSAPAAPVTDASDLFARRDQAMASSLAVLVRKVKRALQDDQNVMIERLRGVSGLVTTEFEDELVQRQRYHEAAVGALGDAVAAGAKFAASENVDATGATDTLVASECAEDLAVTIVVALRKRILADGHEDGSERANAAYKEWRGARVERLCADTARRAFNAGVLAASAGLSVRFLVAPTDAPCDACRHDAASSTRIAGIAFPSGQTHPPLHAGCACIALPVS